MPTSKRDLVKRKHTAISNALTRCIGWTQDLLGQFADPHPDYAEGYANILIMLEQTRIFIERMKDHI